jgi:hypothetical protein
MLHGRPSEHRRQLAPATSRSSAPDRPARRELHRRDRVLQPRGQRFEHRREGLACQCTIAFEPIAELPRSGGNAGTCLSYSIEQHRHRFSAWASGRAASVKGCRFSVEQAKLIIEAVALDRLLVAPDELPLPSDIDEAHADWRSKVIIEAEHRFGLTFTHGIAAKLVNVYLKAAFVCGGHHAHERVEALHPPIDGLLLDELARRELGGQTAAWKNARRVRWSKLNSEQYQDVIDALRGAMPDQPFWHVEQYWRGYQ